MGGSKLLHSSFTVTFFYVSGGLENALFLYLWVSKMAFSCMWGSQNGVFVCEGLKNWQNVTPSPFSNGIDLIKHSYFVRLKIDI